jgi:hypothetical protein
MTVEELIKQLKECPQQEKVVCFVDWKVPDIVIDSISPEDCDGNVVIGNNIPAEKYARDYQYEQGCE